MRIVFLVACVWAPSVFAQGSFQVGYAANLNIGDSTVQITNTGANGAALVGPGFGGAAGNICANVYVFAPDEQLISCCSTLVTPSGLVSLSVNNDLIANTVTSVQPNSLVIKVLSTGAGAAFTGTSCGNGAAFAGTFSYPLASGMLAWGTTLHPGRPAGNFGVTFGVTERRFSPATLSGGELNSITSRCASILANGSGHGNCRVPPPPVVFATCTYNDGDHVLTGDSNACDGATPRTTTRCSYRSFGVQLECDNTQASTLCAAIFNGLADCH